MASLAERQQVCEDAIARSPDIVQSTPGASLESTFITLSELSPLAPSASPNLKRNPVRVVDSDSFAAARSLLSNSDTDGKNPKIAVLNLASDAEPGGGWRYTLSKTQEEALCYSSTLYATLQPGWYPWPNTGPGSVAGIYSPGVAVFRDTLDNGLVEMPKDQHFVVSVITVAAPRHPRLIASGGPDGRTATFAEKSVLEDLRGKIRLVYRCAAHNGQTSLVLGALGCGAYRCPPAVVAREMREILEEAEFAGWFEHVVFAIYAAGLVGQRNLEVFHSEFAMSGI
ncbi:hypothetical protein BD289DRAFT_377780 [Coniella lustricola]|uniref:Microbial-type PARG catalytic domain-containing protein n=1 Tax=Coniella lustricola TaxID=2025994 RepID=A0A2T2ZUZ7_9PEZI|nr:hypothetical protein BD289DRAFT_377780 [Coniella lustricola]